MPSSAQEIIKMIIRDETLKENFLKARKALKSAIKDAKRRSWMELCRTIEEDTWGL